MAGNAAVALEGPQGRPVAARWRELFVDGRARLTVGLLVLELATGIEALIVLAVMPAVVADLGGIAWYGWVASAFSLAGLVAIPIAGRNADRLGAAAPMSRLLTLFVVGTLLCALAPSMPLLAAARLVQGYGAAGQFVIAYQAVAKLYPDRLRARMLALLASVWTISGVLGPAAGSAIGSVTSWRWAFAAVLPVRLIASPLVMPALRRIGPVADPPPRLGAGRPLLLAVGTAALLAAFSGTRLWLLPVAVGGLVAMGVALRHLLPAGTFRAAPGLPAGVATSFLVNVALVGTETFIPLAIVRVRARSLAEAGALIALETVAWSLGTWWQSRVLPRYGLASLGRLGGLVLATGIAMTAALVTDGPLWLVYCGVALAGLGMGVVFPCAMIASMGQARKGREGEAVAARFVAGRLGIALGAGLAGAAVAVSDAAGAPLSRGLAIAFGGCVVFALLGAVAAGGLRPSAD
jgi:MFS family permease